MQEESPTSGLSSNQQTTLIRPSSDLNNGIFQRSFVQVSVGSWAVAVGATRNQVGVLC
jgi:hypothetical protein